MDKESKVLEYKSDINSRTYLKTVSAFANFGDGEIRFGVSDDRQVTPIGNPEKACLDLENQINDSIRPHPDFSIKINIDGTISLFVYKGLATPYLYQGQAYKRNDTSTIPVNDFEMRRLSLFGTNMNFEDLPCGVKNLRFDYLGQRMKEALGLDSFGLDEMKTLNLYSDGAGFSNAGYLFADTNDMAGLDIAVMAQGAEAFKKRRCLAGECLIRQFDEAFALFAEEYVVEQIEGKERRRVELIPAVAFREAVANAIVHRYYDIKANTKVTMSPNEIVISSPGGLYDGLSEADFLKGRYSSLRNPSVAMVFHRLKLIEMFATGIRRINESYRDSSTRPVFAVGDSSIAITLPLIKPLSLNVNEAKVIATMSPNRAYTRAQIEQAASLTKPTVIRTLNGLIAKGRIIKEGHDRTPLYILSR